jgi:hypothetical protein
MGSGSKVNWTLEAGSSQATMLLFTTCINLAFVINYVSAFVKQYNGGGELDKGER